MVQVRYIVHEEVWCGPRKHLRVNKIELVKLSWPQRMGGDWGLGLCWTGWGGLISEVHGCYLVTFLIGPLYVIGVW